jgi:hypothetical protein
MAYSLDFNILDENPLEKPEFAGAPPIDPRFPAGQTLAQAGMNQVYPQGAATWNTLPSFTQAPPATQPPAQPPAQQPVQQPATNPSLEDYIQQFVGYLTPPVNDTKRQKRLQNAALFNALGNAMTQVVNYMGAAQGNPGMMQTSNQTVMAPLAEAEKLRQEYLQQQDQYDRLKLGAIMQGTQMARQDKRYAEEDKWRQKGYDLQEKQFGAQQEQNTWQRGFTEKQAAAQEADRKQAQENWDKTMNENMRQFNVTNQRLKEIFRDVDAVFTQNWCAVVIDSVLERFNIQNVVVPEVEDAQAIVNAAFGEQFDLAGGVAQHPLVRGIHHQPHRTADHHRGDGQDDDDLEQCESPQAATRLGC